MSVPDTTRTKGEQKFLHEYTRTLLVQWAAHQLIFGEIPKPDGKEKGALVFLEHAASKGWVTKDGTKLTSTGFSSAAGRCKGT